MSNLPPTIANMHGDSTQFDIYVYILITKGTWKGLWCGFMDSGDYGGSVGAMVGAMGSLTID